MTDSAVWHDAKRLTINRCHGTLSDVPISLPYTQRRREGFPVTQLRDLENPNSLPLAEGRTQPHNISAPDVGGGHECTSTLFTDEWGACLLTWWITLLNETIMVSLCENHQKKCSSFFGGLYLERHFKLLTIILSLVSCNVSIAFRKVLIMTCSIAYFKCWWLSFWPCRNGAWYTVALLFCSPQNSTAAA